MNRVFGINIINEYHNKFTSCVIILPQYLYICIIIVANALIELD